MATVYIPNLKLFESQKVHFAQLLKNIAVTVGPFLTMNYFALTDVTSFAHTPGTNEDEFDVPSNF